MLCHEGSACGNKYTVQWARKSARPVSDRGNHCDHRAALIYIHRAEEGFLLLVFSLVQKQGEITPLRS